MQFIKCSPLRKYFILCVMHCKGWIMGLTSEQKMHTSAGVDATNLSQQGRGKIISLR